MNDAKHKMLKLAVSKVKMYDTSAAQENPEAKYGPVPMSNNPVLCLDLKEAPFLKGYEVGDLCTIVIKTKVVGHSANESSSHSHEDYRLEVTNIGQVDHTPVDGKTEKGDGAY